MPKAYTPLWDRTSTLQRAGAATEQSHRFPGLIPITERSSNCRLGAGSAFRLLLRAGILLWAHPQPRVKRNKITTRKHLASLFLWTRSGSPPHTLRWLWKTKPCSFCVSDPTRKWEPANGSSSHRQFLLEEGDPDLSVSVLQTIYIPLKDSEEGTGGLDSVWLLLDLLSSLDGARGALFYAITHEDISWCCQTLQYDQVLHSLSYFPFKPQLSLIYHYIRNPWRSSLFPFKNI